MILISTIGNTWIEVYCSSVKNFDIFSTPNALQIDFKSQSGQAEQTKMPNASHYELAEDTVFPCYTKSLLYCKFNTVSAV